MGNVSRPRAAPRRTIRHARRDTDVDLTPRTPAANHGEDVKELYYYLDSTPTHSYMKFLYKYPQNEFPYEKLKQESAHRGREVSEYELLDTDAFDEDRYWDVFVEYAKDEQHVDGISVRITAYNRGPDPADLHILPQVFFRNTWSWPKEMPKDMPEMHQSADGVIEINEPSMGKTHLYCTPSPAPAAPAKGGVVMVDGPSIVPDLLFTENETNYEVGFDEMGCCRPPPLDSLTSSSHPGLVLLLIPHSDSTVARTGRPTSRTPSTTT